MVFMSSPERSTLTRVDLGAMPDDGLRHELLDGVLLVTPAPSVRHQVAVTELLRALFAACPPHLYVLPAPTDVALAEDTVLQPDVLVVDRAAMLDEGTDLRPLLVIEVLSPSTRRIDQTLKKARYERAGIPAYWLVDADDPSLTCWTLRDGRYDEPAVITGADTLVTSVPFLVTISPSQLTP